MRLKPMCSMHHIVYYLKYRPSLKPTLSVIFIFLNHLLMSTKINSKLTPQKSLSTYKPPMINGVTASKVFIPKCTQTSQSLFEYLCEHFEHIDAEEWMQRFQNQLIIDAEGHVLNLDTPYLS